MVIAGGNCGGGIWRPPLRSVRRRRAEEAVHQRGGLAQQGLPLSDGLQERSEVDGKTYKVQ